MNKYVYCLLLIIVSIFPFSAYTTDSLTNPDSNPSSNPDSKAKADDKTYNVAILKHDFIAKQFFHAIAKNLGYKFNYNEFQTFPEVINSISTQSNDLAANMAYTEARAKQFRISQPTNIMHAYFYSKSIKFKDARVIGVPKNSFFQQTIKDEGLDIGVIEYADMSDAINLIEAGSVDGVVDSIYILQKYLNYSYQAEALNDLIPIPPVSFVSSFNFEQDKLDEIAAFITSESMQKTYRNTIENYQLTLRKKAIKREAEKLNIDLSQPINVLLDIHKPLSYYDENGKLVGITPEVLKDICQIMDANCQITVETHLPWPKMLEKLKNKEVDVLAPIVYSEKRKQLFYFSDVYFINDAIIAKRYGYKNNTYNDLSELIMERIGTIEYDYFESLLKQALPNKKFVYYKNLTDEIQGLMNNEVDFILLNKFDYHLAMKNKNNNLPLEIDTFFTHPLNTNDAFAFPKTERGRKLSILFNLSLDIINLQPIIAKYDVTPDWMFILNAQKQSKILIFVFFTILICLIAIFVYFLHRRTVTDELTKLHNRRALYNKYGKKGIKPHVSLIYLDVNNFKMINDNYSHQIGDMVLISLANKIKKHWQGDAYRIGGDEYILVGAYPKEKESELIEKITDFTINTGGDELSINSSSGFYFSETQTVTLDQAMHLADAAMYENKKQYYNKQDPQSDRRKSRS